MYKVAGWIANVVSETRFIFSPLDFKVQFYAWHGSCGFEVSLALSIGEGLASQLFGSTCAAPRMRITDVTDTHAHGLLGSHSELAHCDTPGTAKPFREQSTRKCLMDDEVTTLPGYWQSLLQGGQVFTALLLSTSYSELLDVPRANAFLVGFQNGKSREPN